MHLQKISACLAVLLLVSRLSFSQVITKDSLTNIPVDSLLPRLSNKEQLYKLKDGSIYIYSKPRHFGFITKLPNDASGMVAGVLKKKTVKPLVLITAATGILLLADQSIYDQSQKICSDIGLQTKEENKNILTISIGKKETTLLKLPGNINTAFYQLGQGFTGLLIGAGLYTFGKIKHDYRSLSTASQLAEAFILMGVSTQLIKRITGRETPAVASVSGGKWHLFPSFENFQEHTARYDAFPSGHLATFMSTVTILVENYPEKKWIAPIGYGLTGLVALSMINNGVHWSSDYPLAIGLGYLCGRQLARNSRRILKQHSKGKNKKNLSYTFNYVNGKMMPGIVYKF